MDINFKFGEHNYYGDESSALWEVLLSFIGAAFGFGFALWIYYQETKRDNLKEEQNRLYESRSKLTYFKLLIESVVKTYEEQQLPYLKEFIEDQKVNLLELKTIKRVASNNFIRLINIDNKGIFEAWGEFFKADENWIKDYKRINASIDFLEGSINEIYRIERSNNDKCYERLLEVKEYIDGLPTTLSQFARQLADGLGDKRFANEYYVFIDKTIKDYRKLIDAEADLETVNDLLLQPMLETYFDKFKMNYFPEEVLINAKKARLKMNDTRVDVDHVLQNLERVEEKNLGPLSVLKEAITKIENLTTNQPLSQNFYTRLTKKLGFRKSV